MANKSFMPLDPKASNAFRVSPGLRDSLSFPHRHPVRWTEPISRWGSDRPGAISHEFFCPKLQYSTSKAILSSSFPICPAVYRGKSKIFPTQNLPLLSALLFTPRNAIVPAFLDVPLVCKLYTPWKKRAERSSSLFSLRQLHPDRSVREELLLESRRRDVPPTLPLFLPSKRTIPERLVLATIDRPLLPDPRRTAR
jgi:hypothetical protein